LVTVSWVDQRVTVVCQLSSRPTQPPKGHAKFFSYLVRMRCYLVPTRCISCARDRKFFCMSLRGLRSQVSLCQQHKHQGAYWRYRNGLIYAACRYRYGSNLFMILSTSNYALAYLRATLHNAPQPVSNMIDFSSLNILLHYIRLSLITRV